MRLFPFFLLWLLLLNSTIAQTPTPEVTAPVEQTPVEFSSPRQSLESFLATMGLASALRPDQYLVANGHLDLSEIPRVVREERGVSLSQQLYAILQIVTLDAESLDVEPEQTSVVLYRQPSGDRIELVRGEDGRWLFSSQTVKGIPRMYRLLSSKGKIDGWHIEALNFEVLGVSGNLWMLLILWPLLAYGLGCLAVMALRMTFGPLLQKKVGLELGEQKKLLRPLGWIVASLVAWLGLSFVELPGGLLVTLTVIVKTTACVSLVVAAFRGSDTLALYMSTITATTASKFDDMLIPLVRRCVKTLVAIIGVLFLAQNLDIEVWSLFAGFSIFGAMVALAGQDTVKNFFGSVTVLLDQPFAVGDYVLVDGIEGTVEEVGFRSTRIRTFKDSLVTIPNSQFITATVDNFGARSYRRYSKNISVSWNTPPEKVEAFCEGIREIIRRHPYTRKNYYHVWVYDVNAYALEILLYVFWAVPDWNTEARERHRFLVDVHRLATDLEVELAYPRQKLLLTREEEQYQEDFDIEGLEAARLRGKDRARELLARSLPGDIPPPHVVD